MEAAQSTYPNHVAMPGQRTSAAEVFRSNAAYLRGRADRMELLAKMADGLEPGSEAELAMFEVACRM